ncbi:DNA cytosine methyltransferase [bacterium]|nr:DNA cytosine methyltransferase [bacterium]QQR58995.1 MAG: DNA cytosine methyltransferase [Candidatus Melainabacteria bacterium]
MQKKYRAIEFFSGIGAFRQVGHEFGATTIEAFDQGEDANSVYSLNYNYIPKTRNLDSIKLGQIKEADLWWMSPPCLPYTRKGNGCDVEDSRAQSFLNLLNLVPQILPERILIENVPEFKDSKAMQLLEETLKKHSYNFKTFDLCSSQFGTPMLRRRFFVVASRIGLIEDIELKEQERKTLSSFLKNQKDLDQSLYLNDDMLSQAKIMEAFDIVEKDANRLTCFTSSYGRQHKASGSLYRDTNNKIRYFAAEEIVALLGFSNDFKFPAHLSNQAKWRLAGNSVDTRIILLLLKASGL